MCYVWRLVFCMVNMPGMNTTLTNGKVVLDLWQLVLTVDHHVNWIFCDVCASHHHAGESPLVSQLGLRKQQAGVCSHTHTAPVFVSGANWDVLVPLLDQEVSWKSLSFVLESNTECTCYICPPHMALASSLNESTHPQFMRCHMGRQMRSLCTQTGRGSDMISGCQTDFTILNLLTSTVTYIFPFGHQDVFYFYGFNVAWDLECFPIKAGNSLQTADCKR